MSTTFCVYPGTDNTPTFYEVLQQAHVDLHDYFQSISFFKTTVSLNVEIQTVENHTKIPTNMNGKFIWDSEKYAWFYINGVSGGSDCYLFQHSELDREIWQRELTSSKHSEPIQTIIKQNLDLGYFWCFRRSAGQPCIIALSYGFLAISLAKLTNGFIFSDDGAWDFSMFPALPDDMMDWYFKPDLARSEDDRIFSTNCLKVLMTEFES